MAFLERRTAELERTCKLALRERDLATALAGRPLVPGAAAQLIKLWRDELDVYEEDGQMRVATRDGRPVAGAVEEWLAGPDYAHFRRPTSRGGTATGGTERSVSGTPPAPRPSNLGEAVLHRWRESAAHRGESGTPPVGLVRPRFR